MERLPWSDFRGVFERNRDLVFRFLLRLTRNQADAEDLLQETFLAAWRKRDQYQGGSEASYLRRAAFRLYLNHAERTRRRAALAPVVDGAPEPASPPGDSGLERREATRFLLDRVEEAVAELPDGPREAFVLFRIEGLTCREIAEAQDLPVKTVETRVRRAAQLLAERLRPFRDSLPASGS